MPTLKLGVLISRSYLIYIIAAVGCLFLAFIAVILLQPPQPNISGAGGYQKEDASYRAGGASCEPKQLARLAIGTRESKREACEKAEIEHQEASNNLISARRSANAADATAILIFQQARIAAWGAGLGIVTMFAAIGAAIFAGSAAYQTKRSADAGIDAVNKTGEAIQIARQEFVANHRPKIILREAIIGSVLEGEKITVMFVLANIGETAGTIVDSRITLEIVAENVERLFLHVSVEQHADLGIVPFAAGEQRIFNYPHDDAPPWHAIAFSKQSGPGSGYQTIHLTGQILYRDEFGVPRRTAFRRVLEPKRQRFYRLPHDYEPDLDYAD